MSARVSLGLLGKDVACDVCAIESTDEKSEPREVGESVVVPNQMSDPSAGEGDDQPSSNAAERWLPAIAKDADKELLHGLYLLAEQPHNKRIERFEVDDDESDYDAR